MSGPTNLVRLFDGPVLYFDMSVLRVLTVLLWLARRKKEFVGLRLHLLKPKLHTDDKTSFNFLHAITSFEHMIKVYRFIGFQATVKNIPTIAYTPSFHIMWILSKSKFETGQNLKPRAVRC